MLLLCHVTGQTSAHILLHGDTALENSAGYMELVNRRGQGEPLQYVMGKWDFMGQTLRTDSRALIPRPETELLVEEALNFLRQSRITCGPPRVLDLCTGSGCIAAAIAGAGEYNVTAVDISADALALAKENGQGLGIKFIKSDLFTEIAGRFDLIVSNPPYITTREMTELDPMVLNYEPRLALHGGQDGMDIYRKLIPESLKFLQPGGALFLEIGPAAVMDIMTAAGFIDVQIKNDYAGLPRIIWGKKMEVS